MHRSWLPIMTELDKYGIFELLMRALENMDKRGLEDNVKTDRPPRHLLWKCFDIPLDSVRIIFIGQDPYPGYHNDIPNACGKCFATINGNVPVSLSNIFKLIEKKYKRPIDPSVKDGDLSAWESRGVMLLNKCLLYYPKHSEKEPNIFTTFIYYLLQEICKYFSTRVEKPIFVLFGSTVHTLKDNIAIGYEVILAPHPANRSNAFINSDIFDRLPDIGW